MLKGHKKHTHTHTHTHTLMCRQNAGGKVTRGSKPSFTRSFNLDFPTHTHTHGPVCKHYGRGTRGAQTPGCHVRVKQRTRKTFYLQRRIYRTCPASASLSPRKSPPLSLYCFLRNLKTKARSSSLKVTTLHFTLLLLLLHFLSLSRPPRVHTHRSIHHDSGDCSAAFSDSSA